MGGGQQGGSRGPAEFLERRFGLATLSSLTTTPTPPDSGPAASFRIRPARRGDAEGIAALLGELGYQPGGDPGIVNWVLSHPEMEAIVAADAHEKPIGLVTISHRPQLRLKGRICTIDELVVAAAWRRRGVGRKLMERVFERARVLEVKRMEITTLQGKDPHVLEFFRSAGFSEVDVAVFKIDAADFQKKKP